MDAKQQFIEEYAPIAEDVAKKIGVSPDILLSQWGLETNWGRSVIGHHNLGNIKDFSGKDGDKYLNFEDPEAFGDYYAYLIKRNFPGAVNAGSDISKFAEGLKSGEKGAYAEDKNYADSLANTLDATRSIYEPPKEEPEEEKPLIDRASEAVGKMADDERLTAAGAGAGGAYIGSRLFPEEPVRSQSTAGLERTAMRQEARLGELQRELSQIPPEARQAPTLTRGAPSISLEAPEAPDAQSGLERQLQGTIEDGQTGRARQTGYSELTAQRAARQRDQAAVEAALRRRGVISGPSPFATAPIASTPTGVLVPPGVAEEAAIPAARAQAESQQANRLERQIEETRRNLAVTQSVLAELEKRAPGPLTRIGSIFRTPAAKMIPGAAAGLGYEETRRRLAEEDYPGAALSAAGTLGSGIMALPIAPTSPPLAALKGTGAALGYGGGLGLLLYDLMRRKQAQREEMSATR